MPRSRAELNLTGDWAKTLDGQDFVLANDGQEDKIVLFGTESSLKLLSEANTYYVDGTFRVILQYPISCFQSNSKAQSVFPPSICSSA